MSEFRIPYGGQLPQLKPGQWAKLAIGAVVLIGVLWGGVTCFYTVGADSEAVVLRFGRYHETAGPGLHFKLPFGMDRAMVVPVRKVFAMEFGFRTLRPGKQTVRAQESQAEKKTATMLTGDLNIAKVKWTIQYRINEAKDYLFNVADVQETIRDVSESTMRKLVGDRSVDEVITIGRETLAAKAQVATQEKLNALGCGVKLTQLKLLDVGPPDDVKDAFDAVNRARQKKQQVINQAIEKRNSLVPAARGTAKGDIKVAEAYQKQKILEVTGETNALLKRYEAYQKAKQETRIRLYMETMEKILAQAQRKIFLDESVKGVLPHLDLDGPKGGIR